MSPLVPGAHPWRRLLAIVYETVLLAGVLFAANLVLMALALVLREPAVGRIVLQGFELLVLGTYFGWLWSGGRRTLPMQTLQLCLTTRDGAPVSALRALARFLCVFLLCAGALAAGQLVHPLLFGLVALPFLWSLFDRDCRALYDVLAGTRLAVTESATQSTKK